MTKSFISFAGHRFDEPVQADVPEVELRPSHLGLRRADFQTRIRIRTSGRRQDSADEKEEASAGKNGCLKKNERKQNEGNENLKKC